MQLAMFESVEVGDRVCPSLYPFKPVCRIADKGEEWLVLECRGRRQRLTRDEYNDLGYSFADKP